MAFKDRIDPPVDLVDTTDGCLDWGCAVVCAASTIALVCGGIWFLSGLVKILAR